jgi:alkylation response protein AidB-like acyl-CoA dehydrogenase
MRRTLHDDTHELFACKTDPDERHRGMTLVVVDAGTEGVRARPVAREDRPARPRARPSSSSTTSASPSRTWSATRGRGSAIRSTSRPGWLSITVGAVAHPRAAFEWTLAYCRERGPQTRAMTKWWTTELDCERPHEQ